MDDFTGYVVRTLMVGDVHLSDKAPSTRTESYKDDVLDKLDQIGKIAAVTVDEDRSIDAVIFCGDIFHSKIPRNTSFGLVGELADVLGGYPVPIYILPGNHDYAAQYVHSLPNHPLSLIGKLPNVELFGIPGNEGFAIKNVWFHGVREEQQELDSFYPHTVEDYAGVVVVAHSPIFPPKTGPNWDHIDAADIVAEWVSNYHDDMIWPEIIWYGHIHEPHGHYQVTAWHEDDREYGGTGQEYNVGWVDFANFGSISRGSLHEEDFDRTPQVALLKVVAGYQRTRNEITPIDLVAKPAEEIFRMDEAEADYLEEIEVSEFVSKLGSVSLGAFSIEGLIERLRNGTAGDVPQPVVNRAIDLILEAAG